MFLQSENLERVSMLQTEHLASPLEMMDPELTAIDDKPSMRRTSVSPIKENDDSLSSPALSQLANNKQSVLSTSLFGGYPLGALGGQSVAPLKITMAAEVMNCDAK